VVSHTGWAATGPAPEAEEALLVADVDLAGARAARAWNEFNDPLADRRIDVYG